MCNAVPASSMVFLLWISLFAKASLPKDIRVLLKSTAVNAKIEKPMRVEGFAIQVQNQTWSKTFSLQKLIISAQKNHWIVKDSSHQLKIFSPKLQLDGVGLSIEGEIIDFPISLVIDSGKIKWIARVEFEKYLQQVLPSEMPVDWPMAALQAQMVASQTYALNRIDQSKNAEFDVESTIMAQVFDWRRKLDNRERTTVRNVLASTRGLVLTQNNKPIAAYFHADCGGVLSSASSVWENIEKTSGLRCFPHPSRKWRTEISSSEFKRRINGVPRDNGFTLELQNGRIQNIRVATNDFERVLSGNEFRALFGFDRVWSTIFSVQKNGERLELTGQGMGHGVGLCQTGAQYAALSGKNYKEILARFYPEAKIVAY